MIKPTIIGLTGPAGCGKDTVALVLTTHARFSQVNFADALRSELVSAFCVDQTLFTRRDLKEAPTEQLALSRCTADGFVGRMVVHHQKMSLPLDLHAPQSPRRIMQWWGTEYRRWQDPTYWTRALIGRVHTQQQGHQYRHVIGDVRFTNEAQAVRVMGGVIWQITRPGVAADRGHVSETDGSEFKPDAVLHNLHDIRHLQQLVLGEFWALDAGLDSGSVRVEIAA